MAGQTWIALKRESKLVLAPSWDAPGISSPAYIKRNAANINAIDSADWTCNTGKEMACMFLRRSWMKRSKEVQVCFKMISFQTLAINFGVKIPLDRSAVSRCEAA